MRPNTLTPNRATRNRAAFGETMATRSFSPDAEVVERGGQAARHLGELRVRDAPEPAAGRVGLVHDGLAVAVDELGSLEEITEGEGNDHGTSASSRIGRGPLRRGRSPRIDQATRLRNRSGEAATRRRAAGAPERSAWACFGILLESARADRGGHRRHLHGRRRPGRGRAALHDQGAEHAEGPAGGDRRRGARACSSWPGAPPADVERFIHGTTVATNAVLEQKGAVTALLTTEGFDDILEMGRQKRSRMYDLDMDPETPTFVAPRRRRVGNPGAPGRAGPGARPARRGRRARGGVRAPPRRRPGHRGVLPLLLRQPRPRAADARDLPRGGAGDQRVAVLRGGPDLPRVRAALRDGVRRLPRAGGEALPGGAVVHPRPDGHRRGAAGHALARRHRVGRAGRPGAGDAVPVRPRRAASSARGSPPSDRASPTSCRSTWAAPATTSPSCAEASR